MYIGIRDIHTPKSEKNEKMNRLQKHVVQQKLNDTLSDSSLMETENGEVETTGENDNIHDTF